MKTYPFSRTRKKGTSLSLLFSKYDLHMGRVSHILIVLALPCLWSKPDNLCIGQICCIFLFLSASFFALQCEQSLLMCMKMLGALASSQLTLGKVRLAAVARCLSRAVQLQQKWEVSACRRAMVSRHATIISLLSSACSQISFQIY